MPSNLPQMAHGAPAEKAMAIFVMPQAYRGRGAGPMAEPKREEPKPVLRPAAPPPKPVQKKISPAAPKRHTKGLMIGGVVFVVVFGIVGFFLIQWANKPASSRVVLTPPPAELPSAPPAEISAPSAAPPSATISPFAGAFQSGADTDSDGLTDIEEVEIYHSDSRMPDTDSDGFLDGNEAFNGYDPTAPPPEDLVQGGQAKEFSSAPPISFAAWYPSAWSLALDQAVPADQLFISTTGEQFRLSLKPKFAAQSISDWYVAQGVAGTPRVSITKKGLAFLMAENQLSAFVDLGAEAAALTYEPGTKGTLEYLMTFQMMVNSLAIKP